MRIQIHKRYFKKYYDTKNWDDVPEFLTFQTMPSNMVTVTFEDELEVEEFKDGTDRE